MGWRQTVRGVVPLWECDDNGHLTVRQYLPKFDDSSYLLFFDAGLRLPLLRKRGLTIVSISHDLRYRSELPTESAYRIEAAITHLGRTSVRTAQKMFNADSAKMVATCFGVDALFDLNARQTVPWPDDLRTLLEAATVALSDDDRALFAR